MNIFCLQNFNNYYNRVVRKFNSLTEYQEYQQSKGKGIASFVGINFVPNDYVNTTQILNWQNSWIPDYFVVEDPDTGTLTRWFVIESVRQRGMQYSFELRRDLLVDFYDATVNAPCFIEKATLNQSDPFIYNNEGMTFNQIKTSETLLKDKTNSAWIIGYFADKYTEGENKGQAVSLSCTYIDDLPFQALVNSTFENWEFYPYVNGLANNAAEIVYIQTWNNAPQYGGEWYYALGTTKNWTELISSTDVKSDVKNTLKNVLGINVDLISNWNTRNIDDIDVSNIQYAYNQNGFSDLENYVRATFPLITKEKYNELLNYNNKVVKFIDPENSNNIKYYKITLENVLDTANSTFTSGNYAYKSFMADGGLKTALNTIQKDTGYYYSNVNNNDYYYVRIQYQSTKIKAENLTYGSYETTFPSALYRLTDAPYGMFCIPCPNPGDTVSIKNTGNTNPAAVTIDRNVSLRMAQELGNKYSGGGVIYDIQLLPYCPISQIIQADNSLDLKNDTKLFTPIIKKEEGQEDVIAGYILFASFSSFTLDIPLTNPISNNDIKINSQTDMYRLVSPNYNGQFEFNAAKNGGFDRLNVDCTYKPYNPYIHINPNFSGLYGSDFNDSRGLICGGDFSMTLMTNAWETYQIQHKNYANIFDREVQNMEISNNIARQRDIYRGITGTLGAGVAGGLSGNKGGIPGAIAGAAVGTITAGISSALNYQWNETLRDEAIDYKKDQFGYSLGNIQALPLSISKTTAFTYNNKIFPILEYYTCTDQEKTALANKIAYNGMTVMRIGKINEFINNSWSYNNITSKNYIKGQLIKIEDINCDDFHIANELANEVFKGAFYETKN